MEKKNKGLVVTIIILVVLVLGLGGYICYQKGIINFNGESTQKKQDTKEEVLKYEDSKEIFTGNGDENNLLAIKVNGQWYEAANNSTHYEVFGEYNNRLYYSDDDAFRYIDLSTKDFNSVEWIKYEEKCYSDENNFVGLAYADKGALKDDTIYFTMNSFGWNKERDSYLYTLNVNATSYSDIKKEFKQSGIIDLVINGNLMYYHHWDDGGAATTFFKSYNLDTKEKKTLLKNIESNISFYDKERKILYGQKVSNKENANEKWYLYDLVSDKSTFIAEINYNEGRSTSGMFQLYNDKVYYVDNDVIMKYENGKKEEIYKLNNIRRGGQDGQVVVINDNLFDYSSLTTDKYGYILNGKKATKDEVQKYLDKYSVHMKDGELKTFY